MEARRVAELEVELHLAVNEHLVLGTENSVPLQEQPVLLIAEPDLCS